MAQPSDPAETSLNKDSSPLDLSELENLSFGPDWGTSSPAAFKKQSRSSSSRGNQERTSHQKGPHVKRDRRPAREQREKKEQEPFSPAVEVFFYPEDIPFRALTRAVRTSCKTYELFEITRLILEKPERWVVILKPKPEEQIKEFFCAGPESIPFGTQEDALNYMLKKHLDQFFTTAQVTVDPPKGSFTSVNRCAITGELLAPPNYHLYQQLLQDHHRTHLSHLPFEKFSSKIESVKEQELIDEWVQKMTQRTTYTFKGETEADSPTFDTLESAKHFLLTQHQAKVFTVTDRVRFSGKNMPELPRGPIQKSIEHEHDRQQRFPLDTANNIRGRLRRMKFNIYKKGPKGISYVCGVKRKFRNQSSSFSESIQKIIDFIEQNENTPINKVPEALLGVTPDESGNFQNTPELAQLMQDIRYLVTSGYVTEYGNGNLYIPPVQQAPKKKEKAPDQGTEPKEAEQDEAIEPQSEATPTPESVTTEA